MARFSENFHTTTPDPKYFNKLLFIDARDFVNQMSPGKLQFDVIFTNNSLTFPPFDNVSQAELKSVSFPKMNNDEIYYILDIAEFSGRLLSSDNNGSHDSFAVIHYDNSNMTAGSIKPMKGKDFDDKIVIFNPIEKTFGRLSICFKKYGGEIITIQDIDPAINDISSFLNKYPISLLLEFKCRYY